MIRIDFILKIAGGGSVQRKYQGFLILTIAMILLGSSFIAGKSIVMAIPASVALTARLVVSSVILFPLLILKEGRLPRPDTRCWWLLCVEAAVGVVAFNFLVFSAYNYISAAAVGIVFSVLPVVVATMSALFLSERLPKTAIVAVALAAYGIAQLNHSEVVPGWIEEVTAVGLMLSLGAVVCEGAFTILAKTLARHLSPLAIAALVSLVSLAIVTPVCVCEAGEFDPSTVAPADWLALVWWAIASGVGYFWLWFVGVARVDAHAAGVVTVTLPLSTILLSALVLNENISTAHLIGAGCAIAAVVLVSTPLHFLRSTVNLLDLQRIRRRIQL